MDTNVMRTYKSVAKEPVHHVQYDQVETTHCPIVFLQGEDRWLCTLMLKQGWRVEYSAASDSFTACPEVSSLQYIPPLSPGF
jgi:chitin synthase